jgi:hypothetical protein
MKKSKTIRGLLGIAAAAVITVAAYAAVTFDPATGTGFVGKGDVQTAFGWNNPQLQANAGGVAFQYYATSTATWTCRWVTGEGTNGEQTHNLDRTTIQGVSGVVSYDARARNQINGFILTGWEGTPRIITQGPPLRSCAQPDSEIVDYSETQTGGGLQVGYNGTWVSLF